MMPKRVALVAFVASVVACGGASPPPAVEPSIPVTPAAPGVTRILVGGDSRDDRGHVLPWSFQQAHARGAQAFVFLGDMELSPEFDRVFIRELAWLDPIPF